MLQFGRGGTAALTALFVLLTAIAATSPQAEARLEDHSPGFMPPGVEEREAIIGSLDTDESTIISALVGRVLGLAYYSVQYKFEYTTSAELVDALERGDIDIALGYSGELAARVLDTPAGPGADPEKLYEWVRTELENQHSIVLLDPLGFNSTPALLVKREFAEQHDVSRISDLHAVPNTLHVVGKASIVDGPETGIGALAKHYGLDNIASEGVADDAEDLVYLSLAMGMADIIVDSATTGQIENMDLVVLEDDLGFFPPWQAGLLVNAQAWEDMQPFPRLAWFEHGGGRLDNEEVIARHYAHIGPENRSPANIANRFLRDHQLID